MFSKDVYQTIGVVVGVAGSIASAAGYVVHLLNQKEITRIENEGAEVIARIEGQRRLSEDRLKAEKEGHVREFDIQYSEEYKSYRTAIPNKKRGGPPKEEEQKE
jgi:hypothetical protein